VLLPVVTVVVGSWLVTQSRIAVLEACGKLGNAEEGKGLLLEVVTKALLKTSTEDTIGVCNSGL
jgi:hypothetical protein